MVAVARSGCGVPAFSPNGQIAELRAYVRQRERMLEYAACLRSFGIVR